MSVCLSDCPVCLCLTLVYCGQTVGWIKMKLGMEVDLSPGHIVLDGDQPPPPKGHRPHQFSAHGCCGQTARWIKMSVGLEVDLGPGHIVLDGIPDLPKRSKAPPSFQPMSIVVKRSPISATADHLFNMAADHRGFVFGPPTKGIWWSLSLCNIWLESMQ